MVLKYSCFCLDCRCDEWGCEKGYGYMGFYSYITKPIDVLKFLETVDKVLTPRACPDIL